MEYFVSVVWIALEVICYMVFYAAFFEVKQTKTQAILLFFIFTLIISMYSNFGIDRAIRQVITIVSFVLLSHLFCKAPIVKLFLLTLVNYTFTAIFEVAVLYGTSAFLGISVADLVWRKLTYVTAVTIGKLLPILIAWFLYKIQRNKGDIRIQKKWLWLTLFFPITSVIILVTIFFQYQQSEDLSISAVLLCGFLAVANVAILYIIHNLELVTYQQENTKLLHQKMSLQAENIASLEQSFHSQRKVTHEFEHHLQVLQGLLENQDIGRATEYLQIIRNDRALHSYSVHSCHPVIDVILNQKYHTAVECGIQMNVQTNDLSKLQIPTELLVVLLTNLLDNAIEGCQRIEGKRVIHCAIVHENSLFISVRNTSLPVTIKGGSAESSKPGLEHGYGLQAINYVLNQLHAEFTFNYDEGWFLFVAEISD